MDKVLSKEQQTQLLKMLSKYRLLRRLELRPRCYSYIPEIPQSYSPAHSDVLCLSRATTQSDLTLYFECEDEDYRDDTVLSYKSDICKLHSDSTEDYEVIRMNFVSIVGNAMKEKGAREVNGKYQVHISNIKQFFLDCCITSQGFLNMLTLPLKQQTWISLEGFLQAFENIHSIKFDKSSFFYKTPSPQYLKNFTIQKMICKW